MVREDVHRKLRLLLKMTQENGCTEAEAQNAAGRAQLLMLKHNIESVDLSDPTADDDEEVQTWDDPLGEPSKQMVTWKGRLAVVLSRHNGCFVHWDHRGGNTILRIAGRASDVTTVRYLYGFIVQEMAQGAVRYRGNGRTWMNNWRLGFVDAIGTQLKDARARARREAAEAEQQRTGVPRERALVLVDNRLATLDSRRTDAEKYARSKVRLGRSTSSRARYDGGARGAGRRDGSKVSLGGGNTALGGGSKRLK